jgi:tetratricopeptide (TPR) repeat protein
MSNQTEVKDTQLVSAISAIKTGDAEKARSLLELALADNPDDDRAWQWMAVVADSAEEQKRYLYRALSINPNNTIVREALQQFPDQEQALVPVQPTETVPVPTVFQPIVYYDRSPTQRLASYLLAAFLFCLTGLGFTLIIAGSFLPWASLPGTEMTALEQEGFLTLITGVVGILVAAVGVWRSGCLSLLASIAAISFALVAIGVSAYNFFNLAQLGASPAIGFVFVLTGGLIAILGSVANSFSGLTMLSFAMRE